ncbi:Acetylcholine receptor-like protein cup-4 [Caenorhabditis elegans]|uniref:Acetylcholine receptor-like protein cup-4 n=1 Tax=Caenorhabditis elegans TaxID=6239 RepID=Q9N4R6_CAEEL|nr:Neurotransmitter-gated ion-channel ligand-binding domain-containing protein [Caenorhabditis elegans]CCD70458.1 Neurotransmitter-gated ion-channel ligand-binding domain-containing protein [Caenorhabditis elegans]|eukprot:NP_503167.1 Ligand-Gated ion Channel [Caenorhabditis elegans]
MILLRLISIGVLINFHFGNAASQSTDERKLEAQLLKGYNSKVRPVKVESTVTQVAVYLNIAHVEKVDEHEQTALVHGHLMASWTDEYLKWERKATNISTLSIASSKLWQPALQLYNSARGNSWSLYLTGLPAIVYNTGKVWSRGTFSFFVTCQFDFTNWPYDQQSCPIVITDWVYGLGQVNLSDPATAAGYGKPTIRLSYDPIDETNKRHVGGWEVIDSWKKHCYWGPKGCLDAEPDGNPDWYWSLLEFGITLKRHLPYFSLTIVMPMVSTSLMILLGFWIENFDFNVFLITLNIALQATYGSNILSRMPPGSGRTPKIVHLYSIGLLISAFQVVLIVMSNFLRVRLPSHYEFDFGYDITEIPKKFGLTRFFTTKGLSFDPQELLNPAQLTSEAEIQKEASTSIGISNPLAESGSDTDLLINLPKNSEADLSERSETLGMPDSEKTQKESQKKMRKLEIQLLHIKRFAFFFVIFVYLFAILLVLAT